MGLGLMANEKATKKKITSDLDRAILWARGVLQTDFVVLDCETTGLDPAAGDEAITIGVIDRAGKTLLDARIRPTRPISAGAARTHGISQAQAAKFKPFAKSHPHLARVVRGKVVVSYCIKGFDQAIIARTCINHKLPIIEFDRFEQALYPASVVVGDWNDYHGNYRWQRLETAARQLGVTVENAHSAIGDCATTLAVIEAMAALRLGGEGE